MANIRLPTGNSTGASSRARGLGAPVKLASVRLKKPLLLLAAAVAVTAAAAFLGGWAPRIAVALGLAEGCLACHGDVTGLAGAHAPSAIGCASCHAGDRGTTDKALAHAGMVLIPGNLSDA